MGDRTTLEPTASVHLTLRPDRVHLAFTGELDRAAAPRLRTQLAALDVSWRVMTVDLTGVGFLDCGGVRILCELARSCRKRPVVIAAEPIHLRLLELCGLDRVYDIRSTPPQQTRACRPRR